MQKIRIHPLFVLLCLILLLGGKGLTLGAAAIAVTIHELGHKICAKRRGFLLQGLSLMPYGAVMYAEDGLPDKDGWVIALAGPAVNLLFSLLLSSLWWFFPVVYTLTKELFWANVGIGAFNLLPCYPLDGSRILLCLTEKKTVVLKIVKGVGIVLGTCTAVLFIVSLFYSPSIQLLFLSPMFFTGAFFDVKKETFRVRMAENYFCCDPTFPLEEKTICVLSSVKIKRLISALDGKNVYRVRVMKEGKEIAFLEGKAIEGMFYISGDKTVEDYLYQNSLVGV